MSISASNPKVDWLRIALGVEAANLLGDPLQGTGPVSSAPMAPLRFWRDDGSGDDGGPTVDAGPDKPPDKSADKPPDKPPTKPTAPLM